MILDVRLRCDGRWAGKLRTIDNTITVQDVSAIYYRAQQPWVREPGSNSITGPARQVVPGPRAQSRQAHARVAIYGMFASLPCRWVNHPNSYTDENRLSLLTAAIASGFTLPLSGLANQQHSVNNFLDAVGGNVLATPLVEPEVGSSHSRTALRSAHQNRRPEEFLYQRYAERELETRVIAVGRRLFGFRGSDDLYTLTDTPPEITVATNKYLERTGLRYVVLDFAVPRDGPWILTKADPAADWSWYATQFDLPIADALVDALIQN